MRGVTSKSRLRQTPISNRPCASAPGPGCASQDAVSDAKGVVLAVQSTANAQQSTCAMQRGSAMSHPPGLKRGGCPWKDVRGFEFDLEVFQDLLEIRIFRCGEH